MGDCYAPDFDPEQAREIAMHFEESANMAADYFCPDGVCIQMAAQDLNNTFDLTGIVDSFLSNDALKGLANTTLSDLSDVGIEVRAADQLLQAENHEQAAQIAQQ